MYPFRVLTFRILNKYSWNEKWINDGVKVAGGGWVFKATTLLAIPFSLTISLWFSFWGVNMSKKQPLPFKSQ